MKSNVKNNNKSTSQKQNKNLKPQSSKLEQNSVDKKNNKTSSKGAENKNKKNFSANATNNKKTNKLNSSFKTTKGKTQILNTDSEITSSQNINDDVQNKSNNKFNSSLTATSFQGKYKNLFSKEIVDKDGKILGTINNKNIKDLNNNVIAILQDKEEVGKENNKKTVLKKYSSITTKDVFVVDNKEVIKNNKQIGVLSLPASFSIRIYSIIISFLLLALISLTIVYFTVPFKIKPIIDIRDNNGAWSTQKGLMVFDQKLQPGVEGEYSFIIRNPHDAVLEYTLEFEKEVENATINYFPIQFMLQSQNLAGTGYKDINNFKVTNLLLQPNAEEEFCLKWKWPFDSSHNEDDTIIALNNNKISVVIIISAVAK